VHSSQFLLLCFGILGGGLAENVRITSYGGRCVKLLKKNVMWYVNVP